MCSRRLVRISTHVSKSFFMFVPIAREYTFRPMNVRCNANEPASRFHGFDNTTAAFRTQSAPSSPMYYHRCQSIFSASKKCSIAHLVHTLVKIFAPNENPIPNSGRFGNSFLNHRTVCLTSHVARALYKMLLVIFE